MSNSAELNFFYNIDFDFGSIIKSILQDDYLSNESGRYQYKNYEIRYLTGKSFEIRNKHIHGYKKVVKYFDIAQFYADSKGIPTLDHAAKTWLGIGKNNEELNLNRESIGNQAGYYEEHRADIIKYCIQDAKLTMQLADLKIKSFAEFLNYIPKSYYSTASIAKAYYTLNHRSLSGAYYRLLQTLKEPAKANNLITQCFSGGIFYIHKLGHSEDVWEYDINSAYPHKISLLYSLSNARIQYTDKYMPDSDYSFYKVRMTNQSNLPIHYRTGNTEVMYVRNHIPVVNYITGAEIEYFRQFHSKDISIEAIEGYAVYTDRIPEFPEYHELYSKRISIKEAMAEEHDSNRKKQLDSEQYNIKIILNSSYGVFAERKNGYVSLTNMIYAAYITALTRIDIYKAIDRIGYDHIIAIMTDAVITDMPIDDTDFDSKELGKFKLEAKARNFTVFSNGNYMIGDKVQSRGFPTLKRHPELLKNASGNKIKIPRTAPVKVKEAIAQKRIKDIGDFQDKPKVFDLESNRHRYKFNNPENLTFEYLRENILETVPYDITELPDKYSKCPFHLQAHAKEFMKSIHKYSTSGIGKIRIPEYQYDPFWASSGNIKIPLTKPFKMPELEWIVKMLAVMQGKNPHRDYTRLQKKYPSLSHNLDEDRHTILLLLFFGMIVLLGITNVDLTHFTGFTIDLNAIFA